MPSFLPEGNIPLPSDNEKRSLHKVVDLEGGQDAGGGGGTVTGTGTVDRVPVWTSASAQGNSYLLQDANGVLLDTGKDLTVQGLGQILIPDGSAAAPSLAFSGDPNSGLYTPGVNSAALALGGTARVNWITTAVKIPSANTYSWADSSDATSAIDTSLSRNAAGYVGVTSGFRVPNGTAAAPSYSFSGNTDRGFYNVSAQGLYVSVTGVPRALFNNAGMQLSSAGAIAWSSDTAFTTADLFLVRDAANIAAFKNSTSAQELRIYNTDAAADEFVSIGFINNANVLTIETEQSGGGTVRGMLLAGSTVSVGKVHAAAFSGDNDTIIRTLHVEHPTANIGSGLVLAANQSTASGGAVGSVQFVNYNIGATDKRVGIIESATDGATNSGRLVFWTSAAGTLAERLRITNTGHLAALRSLSVGSNTDPGDNNALIDGYLWMPEISAPSAPAANIGLIYIKDDGGVTKAFLKTDANDFDLTAGSGNAKSVKFAKTAQTSISTATTASIVGTGSGSATLAANFFTVGKSVRIVGRGNLSNQATPGNGTLDLKVGGASVASTGGQSLVANANVPYWFEAIITCRATGATGTIIANVMFSHGATATAYETWASGVAESTVDTTGTLAVDLEWTFDAASNTFLSEILTIEEMALQ